MFKRKSFSLFAISFIFLCLFYPKTLFAVQTDIPTYNSKADIPLTDDVKTAISEYCDYYEVKESMVYATITHESGFNADAIGQNTNGTIDSGLMQINTVNQKSLEDKLDITNFYDPLQNIQAGIFLLGEFSKKYDDDRQVYLAYHLGEQGMLNAWEAGTRTNSASEHKLELQKYYEEILKK